MKALALAALLVVLGAGLLYFVLDSDGGRGRQAGRASASPSAGATAPSDEVPAVAAEPPEAVESRADARSQRQSVESGAAPEIRLVLEGTAIAEGAPIPGASVSLLRHEAQLAETRTDARGRFRLECAPLTSPGTLRLVARGFVPTERNLAPKPAGGTVMLGNLRLLRGQRLVGRVVDPRNAGVADAEVTAEPVQAGGDLLVARGRSGPDGKFEISDAPPGPLLVTGRAKGFGEATVQRVGTEELTIHLLPGSDLRIVLRTPRGQPVAGAEVSIQAPNDTRPARRVAESEADGRVVFEGLGSLNWTVRVAHPDYRTTPRSVQATGAEEVIECVPWPAIEGRVRAPGGLDPPPGTRVLALPAAAPSDRVGQIEGGEALRPDGSFRLGGLRAGDWRVRVVAPGFAPATSPPVKLGIEGDGFVGTIELQSGGSLEFLLTLEKKPLAGAELEIFPTKPTPAQLWAMASAKVPGQRASSGPDGRAKLPNLAPGTVWVSIYADGCPPTSSGPHVVGTAPGQPIAVELVRGARIHGRVTKRTGVPAARAQVRVVERAGLLGFPLTLVTEADGSYTSAWLPSGHYSIEAFAPEEPTLRSGQVELDVTPGEQRKLDLQL
jgi:hypothetical protein